MATKYLNQNATPGNLLERTMGMPPQGPRAVPIALNFADFDTYNLDYSNMQNQGFLSMCQTLWVDNYANGQVMTITIPASQQTLKIPAGVQGYFPVICPNPIKMTFNSTGGVACQVALLNYPVLT